MPLEHRSTGAQAPSLPGRGRQGCSSAALERALLAADAVGAGCSPAGAVTASQFRAGLNAFMRALPSQVAAEEEHVWVSGCGCECSHTEKIKPLK